jgi:ATP/maltotriose-dependent transcriptional regulator MalT
LPYLLLEGKWRSARDLALLGIESSDRTSEKHLISGVVLARIAREEGDSVLAWQLVHRMLPAGSQTATGHADFATSLSLMRVAALLSLDEGNLAAARAWLDAHDRWLSWSGAVLGQADGQILWTHFYRVMGDLPHARKHAGQALVLAHSPRQPLALLTAHRLQGELYTQLGELTEARRQLDAAYSLAEACAATYERALILLAFAELERCSGAPAAAATALDAARSIFEALGAAPALARAGELAALLADGAPVEPFAGIGLTPREIEVLRLVANGGRNRDIAEELFLSVRTVERHITNLYAKIGVSSRSEAIAFALAHNLHESLTRPT